MLVIIIAHLSTIIAFNMWVLLVCPPTGVDFHSSISVNASVTISTVCTNTRKIYSITYNDPLHIVSWVIFIFYQHLINSAYCFWGIFLFPSEKYYPVSWKQITCLYLHHKLKPYPDMYRSYPYFLGILMLLFSLHL